MASILSSLQNTIIAGVVITVVMVVIIEIVF